MADIFLDTDMKALLAGKRVLLFGDSNVRAMYKDWLWLMTYNTILPEICLKSKLEKSFANDSLVANSTLHRGRDFTEMREYKDKSFYLHFTFVTKCITRDIRDALAEIKSGKKPAPDIIIFNSCLWDISRWGPNGVTEYQKNMSALMSLFHESLPASSRVIFTTTLPLSLSMRGGFLVQQVDFLTAILPYEVMEANLFMRQLVAAHGFDVMDLHFHMRHQLHRRRKDGVHWEPIAIRHMTNLLLTHIALSLGAPLPGRARPHALNRMASMDSAPWTDQTVSEVARSNADQRKVESPAGHMTRSKRRRLKHAKSQEAKRRFGEERQHQVRQ